MNAAKYRHVMLPLIVSGICLLVMAGLSAYAWSVIPSGAKIPIHWGMDGQVNGYGSKATGLLLTPAMVVFISGLFLSIAVVEPRAQHIQQSRKPIGAIWIAMVVFLTVLHIPLVMAALGRPVDVFLVVSLGIAALFCVLGNYLGKVRSNFFIGVRTPWTLTSEISWNKSNRLAGKLFMLSGLLVALAACTLGARVTTGVLVLSTLFTAVVSIVYSYEVWKVDPNRRRTP